MTEQEAYIEGFRKTAEAYGINPEQLAKTAQWLPGLQTGGMWSTPFSYTPMTNSQSTRSVQPQQAAPKYNTNGYAPAPVAKIGRNGIPNYQGPYMRTTGGNDAKYSKEYALPVGSSGNNLSLHEAYTTDLNGKAMSIDASPMRARMAMNPQYAAWVGAHNETVGRLNDKMKGMSSEARRNFFKDPVSRQEANDFYHNTMHSLTSSVPISVSSPIK